MKLKASLFSIVLVSFLLLESCLNMDIGSQTARETDFDKYNTYAWVRRAKHGKHADARIDNAIVEGRIIGNVNKEMKKRGFVVDTLNPDILLDFDIMTEQVVNDVPEPSYVGDYYYSQSFTGSYSPFNIWPGNGNGQSVGKSKYTDGTVVIYAGDREKNQLLWQAWANGSIISVRGFEEELPKDIRAMFRSFPKRKN